MLPKPISKIILFVAVVLFQSGGRSLYTRKKATKPATTTLPIYGLKLNILTFLFLFVLPFTCIVEAQTLGRVTFSSGGSASTNQLPVSFGEVYVGGNDQVTMGSQQNSFDLTISSDEPQSLLELQVFPNPTSGNIRIAFMSEVPTSGYLLISTSGGQIIHRQYFEAQPFEINTSSLMTGLYMLTLFNHNGNLLKAHTFIKQ